MTRRFILPLCAVLALAALTARAYNLDGERWKTIPVTMQLQLGPVSGTLIDGSASWGAVAEDALGTWNAVLTNFRFSVVRDSTATQVRGNRINNVFFSSTIYGAAFDSRTLAVTLLSTTSSNGVSNGFYEADVLFNTAKSWNSYRGALRYNGTTSITDFRRVAIHEFGHVLGLDHPDDVGQRVTAVMNATVSDVDTLAADDIAGARAIYDPATVVIAPTISAQPASQTVTAGTAVSFSVTAAGTAPLSFQWYRNSLTAIPGATGASLTLAAVAASDAGNYTVTVSNAAGSATSTAAVLTVNPAPAGPTSRLSNLSVRTTLAAKQVLTVGFTMSGGAKSVLVRAVGPSLAQFGIADRMADPSLTLYANGVRTDANDDWAGSSAVAATAAAVGAFPLSSVNSFDAALVRSINGGNTVEVTGSPIALTQAATAGTVIVEAYDAGTGVTPRLVNLSARNQVGTGGNILIAGFTLAGTGTKNLLIRAVGPGLAAFGVGGVLADPKLEIYTAAATPVKINENDNWSPTLASTFASAGAFALTAGSKDAALTVSLPPGGYTVQVSGADGGTGNAIVELYELP